MSRRSIDPAQLPLAFLVSSEVIPQADGSVLVRPGKPVGVGWLSAKQLAGEFGRSPAAVYRWREEGWIPEEMVKFAGARNMLFRADVVAHLNARFEACHDR